MTSRSSRLGAPSPKNTIGKLSLWHDPKGLQRDFLGTCFALFTPQHFLTAAHCVGDCLPDQVRVEATFGGINQAAPVDWIQKHPEADLALLQVKTSPWSSATPFVNVRHDPLLGEPFYAFGYPCDVFSEQPDKETDRLFRGHLQRFFHYKSRFGYLYPALELNIPCPRGLSGGPVFATEGPFEVMGVVTENLESMNYSHSEEEVSQDGTTVRTRYQTVVNYGVAVELGPYADWVKQRVGAWAD